MADLSGGTTIGGYLALHTGMTEISLMGNINLTSANRMKTSFPNGYTFNLAGGIRSAGATTSSVWGTGDGNIHIDSATNKGVYINWHSGAATSGDPLVVGNGTESSLFKVSRTGDLVLDAGTILTPNNKNVGLQNASGTNWFKPQDSNGNLHILAGSNRMYLGAPAITLESHNGTGTFATFDTTGMNLYWGAMRIHGSNPYYFETHGGGWYMQDATWIRTYNSKSIYAGSGTIATDGAVSAGTSNSFAKLTSLLGTNGMPRPVSNTTTAAYVENNTDSNGQHGLVVATRWGGMGSTIFEAATYWADGSQAYIPLLSVYGDKSVRITRKLVIPVGTDMYAT